VTGEQSPARIRMCLLPSVTCRGRARSVCTNDVHQAMYKRGQVGFQTLLALALVRHDCSLGEFLDRELYRAVHFSIEEQLLSRNAERFRGGLVFKARRLLFHSTLGSRGIQKKKRRAESSADQNVPVAVRHLPRESEERLYWTRKFKLPWREAGPPDHHDDKVDSDLNVVNKELCLVPSSLGRRRHISLTWTHSGFRRWVESR